jgi:hypothetical protein
MILPELQHEAGHKDVESIKALLRELRMKFKDLSFNRADMARAEAIDALSLLLETKDFSKTVIIPHKQIKKIRKYCATLNDTDLIRKVETVFFALSTKKMYVDWLETLPEEQYKEVTFKIAEYISAGVSFEDIQLRAAAIRQLVSNDAENLNVTVKSIFPDFSGDQVNDEALTAFFEDPFYDWFFEVCTLQPDVKAFELTWLGNWSTKRKEKLRELYKPIKISNSMTFSLPPKDWVQCSSSEYWLFDSFDKDAVQVLYSREGEPIISLKHFGKFAGLVLRSFETPDGFIVPQGAWITLAYPDDREYFEAAFASGRTKVMLPESSQWYVMRGVQPGNLLRSTQEDHIDTFWEDVEKGNAQLRKRVITQPNAHSLSDLKKQFQALKAQRRERIAAERKRHDFGN